MSANQKFWVLGHRVTYVDTKGDSYLPESHIEDGTPRYHVVT